MKKNGQAAAFYDLEGTLVSTNLVHTLGFYARRQQGLFATIKKSAGTLAKLPLFGITDLYSRNVFNELFFKSYEGESEDRLRYSRRSFLKTFSNLPFTTARPNSSPRQKNSVNAKSSSPVRSILPSNRSLIIWA